LKHPINRLFVVWQNPFAVRLVKRPYGFFGRCDHIAPTVIVNVKNRIPGEVDEKQIVLNLRIYRHIPIAKRLYQVNVLYIGHLASERIPMGLQTFAVFIEIFKNPWYDLVLQSIQHLFGFYIVLKYLYSSPSPQILFSMMYIGDHPHLVMGGMKRLEKGQCPKIDTLHILFAIVFIWVSQFKPNPDRPIVKERRPYLQIWKSIV
jgi:hypothetical protein